MSNKDKSHVVIEGQYVNFRFISALNQDGRKTNAKTAHWEADGEGGWSTVLKTSSYKEAKRMVTKQLQDGTIAAAYAARLDVQERLASLRKQARSSRPMGEDERSEGRDLVEGFGAYDLE